jgi:hypothetical protein
MGCKCPRPQKDKKEKNMEGRVRDGMQFDTGMWHDERLTSGAGERVAESTGGTHLNQIK